MKKRLQLLALSALCVLFVHAQYVAPSEGVFRIINLEYGNAMMEDFVRKTVHAAEIGGDEDYEQMWMLRKSGTGYTLQNVFTGNYIQTGNDANNVAYWTGAEADVFNIVENLAWEDESYNIWDTGLTYYAGLHYSPEQAAVVRWWHESSKKASEWRFVSVNITEEQIAKAKEEFERLTGGDNLDNYQSVLDEVFEDSACTVLSSTYAAMDTAAIRTALSDKLPAALVEMAVKVKDGDWTEANEKADKPGWDSKYAKQFRVQMIEPYSIAGEITTWIGHQGHSNMDNPIGVYANKRDVLYIMVEGEIKEGAELYACWINGHSKMPNYKNGYSNGVPLKSGLNIVPFGSDGSALYINYLVHTYDTDNKEFTNKLSDYDDLKVHIEGGYINGYYNSVGDELYEADCDSTWMYYEERANLANITILGRYEVLQFELNDVVQTETDDNGKTSTWEHRGLAALFPDELPASLPANQRINAIIEAWDRIVLSEKMTLGVASRAEVDSMNKLYPRWDGKWENKAEIYNYDDALYAFCDSIKDRDGDYGEYYNHHALAFGTRTGYMYGSWDHSGYHINTTPDILTKIATEAGPAWGPAHEIGHQHQALYTLNGETEVTNNTFANIAVWYMGMGTSRINATDGNLAHVYDNFKNGGFLLSNNIWALTHRYYHLWLYYHRVGNNTQFFPRLFELIRQRPMEGSYSSGSEMRPNDKGVMENVSFQLTNGYRSYLHFYKLCCEAAQEDLTEFFRAYGCFTPVDGAFVGDYTNSKYYTTQQEIDKAIAEVKRKNYPVNNKILFINDCTPDKTYRHDGVTPREYWDDAAQDGHPTRNGINAEVGCYVDYLKGTPITGDYVYSLVNLKLTIEGGEGAVGFAIYNQKNEILAFSNHHTFSLNKDVVSMLRTGEATLYAVAATDDDVVVKNKALQDTPEEQLKKLQEALKTAKSYIARTDTTGNRIGYLIPDSITSYVELINKIDTVIANADTTEYRYGEWYVTLDAANAEIAANRTKRVPLTLGNFYSFAVSENECQYLSNATAGLITLNLKDGATMVEQWKLVPTETEGTFYMQHRETGNYISYAQNGVRAKAASNKISEAVAFTLVAEVPGEFYIERADNADLRLFNQVIVQSQQVFVGKQNNASARWLISMEDEMLALPDTSTSEELAIYYLLNTRHNEYAYQKGTGRDKGKVASNALESNDDFNFWFYFTQGSEEGKYAIYNYATGLPVTASNGSLYANKKADEAPEYAIALNEEGTGMVISAEEGVWNISFSKDMAKLSTQDTTLWKLQYARTINLIYEPLTSITLDKTTATLTEGDSITLTFTTAPVYATDHTITWSSNKEEVATVDANGQVKAIAVGKATITATANDGSGVKATCSVTVKAKPEDTRIDAATTTLSVQSSEGVITIDGVVDGTVVSVYDVVGKQIAATTATSSTMTIDTKLAKGNTVIVKVGEHYMKIALR